MTIVRNRRSRFMNLTFAALAIMALGIIALTLSGNESPTASAQPSSPCDEELRATLCVSKETIGGDSTFRFDIRPDDEGDSQPQCLQPGVPIQPETFYLSDGDSEGIYFRCSLRIVEQPQPGWQLVDINCRYDDELWEITRISNGLLIVSNPASFDSLSFAIDCTFVNRRIQESLNLGGLFAGQPTPLPTAPPPPAAVAPAPSQGISPPRTGDGGLR